MTDNKTKKEELNEKIKDFLEIKELITNMGKNFRAQESVRFMFFALSHLEDYLPDDKEIMIALRDIYGSLKKITEIMSSYPEDDAKIKSAFQNMGNENDR